MNDRPDGSESSDSSRPAQPLTSPAPSELAATDADVTEAFTAFHRVTAPKLMAFMRWSGVSYYDAADCVHEALALAYQQWATLDHPHAWCRVVASRLYARRVAKVREDPSADLDSVEPGTLGNPLIAPGADLDALEHRHTVLDLLDQLPPRQRQVMAWVYDGATISEIADALQITPETVSSNLYKARSTLRLYWRKSVGEDK